MLTIKPLSLAHSTICHRLRVLAFYCVLGGASQLSYGQDNTLHRQMDTLKTDYPQRDMSDIILPLIHKEKPQSLDPSKVDSVKYHLSVVPAFGYTLSTGFAGILAGNVAFYTVDPMHTNVSNVLANIVYSQYNQLTVQSQADIWTRGNKYNIIADWRYYYFPQDTYGLGGHSSLSNSNDLVYSHFRIHQSVLRKTLPNFYAGVGYYLDWHWNVTQSGLASGEVSDATLYGLPRHSISSGPVINLLYDNRKNSINPEKGLFANVIYRDNLHWWGSDQQWESLLIDIRKYLPFPAGSHNVLAFWSYNWLTLSGTPPYLDLPSTGWDNYNNTGRGYIQGRFRSLDMVYLEAEYRFGITRNGLFGGVVFANAQSFSNYPNGGIDAVWPGVGLGLRLKVNKNSRTNLAIDYGFGMDGSHGFFVNLGEVF